MDYVQSFKGKKSLTENIDSEGKANHPTSWKISRLRKLWTSQTETKKGEDQQNTPRCEHDVHSPNHKEAFVQSESLADPKVTKRIRTLKVKTIHWQISES